MTAQILGEMGFQSLVFAKDGENALDQLAQGQINGNPIGLVICDWRMPKMSGLAFLKTIRSKPEWSKLPFLILTAVNQMEELTMALAAGADNYLIKPPDKKALQKKLEDIWAKTSKA